MIHYHGTPMWPNAAAAEIYPNAHLFICVDHVDQMELALLCCASFATDNGAFPAWRNGKPVSDWTHYYLWIQEVHRYPQFDFAVIPDVIDGTEEENDALIEQWPWLRTSPHIGAPVWHMHESLARLERLALSFPRVCIGSSGRYASVGGAAWWSRIRAAMSTVCDKSGRPVCKLHGLRMLNPAVFSKLPLSSADSTNIAINSKLDSKWKGTYTPVTVGARGANMRRLIESHQALTLWDRAQWAENLRQEQIMDLI